MKLKEKILVFNVLLMVVSIFYSLFLLSISMFGFLFLCVYEMWENKLSFKKEIKSATPFIVLSLVFWGIVFSGINSSDLSNWTRHLRLKLPFLFLPFCFYVLRESIAKYQDWIKIGFLATCVFSSIQVLVQFINPDTVIFEIAKGRSLDTPVDHIKYSLFIAFGVILSFLKFRDSKHSSRRVLYLFVAILLFVTLHLLAVRSGLVVFYFTALVLTLRAFIRNPSFVSALVIATIVISPFIAYKTVPSIQKKIEYSLYDFKMYRQGKGDMYSDSERIYSGIVGTKIFKESPILGSGIGDLKDACTKIYTSELNKKSVKYPHNQFLFILAGMGIVGLIFFMVGMYFPAFYYRKNMEDLFLAILIIYLTSFAVENTLERSYSIAFYLLFLLVPMCTLAVSNENR